MRIRHKLLFTAMTVTAVKSKYILQTVYYYNIEINCTCLYYEFESKSVSPYVTLSQLNRYTH